MHIKLIFKQLIIKQLICIYYKSISKSFFQRKKCYADIYKTFLFSFTDIPGFPAKLLHDIFVCWKFNNATLHHLEANEFTSCPSTSDRCVKRDADEIVHFRFASVRKI